MMPPRACESFSVLLGGKTSSHTHADIFFGLNAVRVLSIIAMILVFASSIFVLVNDVQAVNRSIASHDDMPNCDYIEYVSLTSPNESDSHLSQFAEEAPSRTSPPASSGQS